MCTGDAVNSTVPLHQPHRIPGKIKINNVSALLKVQAFREDVCANEQIEFVLLRARRRARRLGRKAPYRIAPRDSVPNFISESVMIGFKSGVALHRCGASAGGS